MRIVYLCHFFHPEPGAPSARIYEMSKEWVKAGHPVTVLTGFPSHPDGKLILQYHAKLAAEEQLDGIRVLRTYKYPTPNKGFLKRMLNQLSFALSSVVFGLLRLGRQDIIIISSPTLFSGISAYILSRLKRIPYIIEVRDLWPDAFIELGILQNRKIIRSLECIEIFLYKKAERIVVLTNSFKEHIIKKGIQAHKIECIPNGADLEFFKPVPKTNNIISKYSVNGKFIVSYIGAHGISQALEHVVHTADMLQGEKEILFLFVGDGAEKNKLIGLKKRLGIENIRFLPVLPKKEIFEIYSVSDACLVPLRNIPIFDLFVPSKMFEIMAAGRPFIAGLKGEAKNIAMESGAALIYEPENSRQLKDSIEKLKSDHEFRERLGLNGRRFVEQHHSRARLAQRYIDLIKTVLSHS